MLFVLAARHAEAAPFIERYKLKKDMNARPLALFRSPREAARELAVTVCVCGDGASPSELAAAVGFLAGRYGITRDADHRLIFAMSDRQSGSPDTCTHRIIMPSTIRDTRSGLSCYPEQIYSHSHKTGELDSPEAAAVFEAASRYFMLKDITVAVTNGNLLDTGVFRPSRPYSHIYVERAAFNYPLTQKVLEKIPRAEVIAVRHYKDVFNRSGQDFAAQKNSPKLILAVREKNFIFPGAQVCDRYGYDRFFYSTQMMNCPYGCAYCYLRGMYPSANIVAFVNTGDYFENARRFLNGPSYLSVSYDSDLLSMEPLFGFASGWINFAAENPDITVEIRTKSAALPKTPPVPNVILSWTVTPSGQAALYEKKAPSLSRRLESARAAANAGWRVRLCADPVLALGDWEKELTALFGAVSNVFKKEELEGITAGGFRMSKTYFKRIRRDEKLFTDLPLGEYDGVMRYSPEDEEKIFRCYNCFT